MQPTERVADLLRRVIESVRSDPGNDALLIAQQAEHDALTDDEKAWFAGHHWVDGQFITMDQLLASWDEDD